MNLTRRGAFQAQADPSTPLVESGRYVNHVLLEHTHPILRSVSMVPAGGTYFLLRGAPGDFLNELQVIRTDADGRPDPAYGPGGALALRTGVGFGQVEAYWTGSQLICATADDFDDVRVWLLDANGTPNPAFGVGGQRTIDAAGLLRSALSPQLGHLTTPALRVVIVFGTGFPAPDHIRYAVLDAQGGFVTPPRDLVTGGRHRPPWLVPCRRERVAVYRCMAPAGRRETHRVRQPVRAGWRRQARR